MFAAFGIELNNMLWTAACTVIGALLNENKIKQQ